MITPPCLPVYTDSRFAVVTSKIETIQIRFMTTTVPPGSFVFLGTAGIGSMIVVLIFGRERNTTMRAKGVSSSSCKVKAKNINIYNPSMQQGPNGLVFSPERIIYKFFLLFRVKCGLNRPFARWRHTTTTRILFVFPFIFKLGVIID